MTTNLALFTESYINGPSDEELNEALETLEIEHIEANSLQNALKISANSCYGVTAAPSCMWYDRDLGEAITLTGQYTVNNAANKLNEYLRKVTKDPDATFAVYMDTDSVYLTMNELVKMYMTGKSEDEIEQFIDKTCSGPLKKVLGDTFKEQAVMTNCIKPRINMKRELIADKGVFVQAKHYVLHVRNKEGGIRLNVPKVYMKGIAAVRTSTPPACRKKIEEAIDIIFKKDQKAVIEFVENFKKEFKSLPLDEIASVSSCNNLATYYDPFTKQCAKGTPMQVKASVLFNRNLDHFGVNDRYEAITEGEKVKYVYLKMPNPAKTQVIAYKTVLPKEFGLHAYIDHDVQFEKTFISPVKKILDIMGWSTEEVNDVNDFFS